MRARFPLFLSLMALALGGCDTRIASSDRAVQQNSVAVELLATGEPVAGILDDAAGFPKHRCLTCHAADRSIMVAPSFSSIAQRYSDNGNAITILAGSLANGSHGKWADYRNDAMPPQPQLSEREKKALVQWILSQKAAP